MTHLKVIMVVIVEWRSLFLNICQVIKLFHLFFQVYSFYHFLEYNIRSGVTQNLLFIPPYPDHYLAYLIHLCEYLNSQKKILAYS
jgi:hypothetical protein